jgi:3-phytase
MFNNFLIKRGWFLSSFLLLLSCGPLQNKEAIDDDKTYRKAVGWQNEFSRRIPAKVETDPVEAPSVNDDAADDPALWLHPTTPEKSLIFGSNKVYGIHTYNLEGKEVQYVKYARINNVDIRQSVRWNKSKYDILGGSNRDEKSVDIFLIDENGQIGSQPDLQIALGDIKPYGFCLYHPEPESLYAFVNDKDGNIFQISITMNLSGKLQAKEVRRLKLDTQVEGMVADDIRKVLYVGEEMVGIHVFQADADLDTRSYMLNGSTRSNKAIKYDIEGLALLPPHYLLASSQGNFSYAVFDIEQNKYVTSFIIPEDNHDGVQETDGIEIMAQPMGITFPKGVLVVQDGFNYDGKIKKNQNFKIVDLGEIINLLKQ